MKYVLCAVAVPVCWLCYLAIVGMDEQIVASSTRNVVRFSDAATAQQAVAISTSFQAIDNIEVRLVGMRTGEGGLGPNEVQLQVDIAGKHRRRLLDSPEFHVGVRSDMKDLIRAHLVSVTGDDGLEITTMNVGYLAEDG